MEPTNLDLLRMQVEPLALGLGFRVNRISTDNTATQIAKKSSYMCTTTFVYINNQSMKWRGT
jgi:hypothetical protein